MILYAVIMLVVAALFGVLAVLIRKGRTDLIHDYHQTHVTDKTGYCKAFSNALWVMSVTMAVSGIVGMLGEAAIWASVAVLGAGFVAGSAAILRVQKKYNGGLF